MTITVRLRALRRPRVRGLSPRRVRVAAAVSALTLGLTALAVAGPATAAPYDRTGDGLVTAAAVTTASARRLAYDTTSTKERHRVDRVKTPKLSWHTCKTSFRCATVSLPLDYDHPTGAKTKVALLKYPARTTNKIGTLFVNPGGPGGSGTDFATSAPDFLPAAILDRFDVVGFDPRGTASSSNVSCFSSTAAQDKALAGLYGIAFPDSASTAKTYLTSLRALGKACAGPGKPLSVSMSTAQVARDLDVLRRAVGDRQLSYLGFSYGTYIGQVYANLFPDRTRALVLDGVVDPTGWQGSTSTHNDPAWDRIRSAETSGHALAEVLRRCGAAGPSSCTFAGDGNPTSNFDVLARRLKAAPLLLDNGSGGSYRYGYDDLVSEVLDDLYSVDGAVQVDAALSDLWTLSAPATSSAARERAARSLSRVHRVLAQRRVAATGYDNSTDAFTAVNCTDSPLIDHLSSLPSVAAKADARVKYFGALWAWNALGCAKDTFTAHDEDAYRGSFTHKTRAKLLFVGDTYDPVTSLAAATKAAGLAPASALISSDSWGHTAYGTSACVDAAVNHYLLTGATPTLKVTRCSGDYQPFTASRSTTAVQAPVSGQLTGVGRPQTGPADATGGR